MPAGLGAEVRSAGASADEGSEGDLAGQPGRRLVGGPRGGLGFALQVRAGGAFAPGRAFLPGQDFSAAGKAPRRGQGRPARARVMDGGRGPGAHLVQGDGKEGPGDQGEEEVDARGVPAAA